MQNTIGVHLCWIVVKDIQKAIEFYTNTIGLKLKEYNEEFGWAELSGEEGSIVGLAQENPHIDSKAGTNAVITITVKDLVKACDHFLKQGATLVGEIIEIPGHVKMQTFLDKDRNTLQLAQILGQSKK